MTRQEAIALVREVSNYMATRPEIDEAIDMAIEALEQEPIIYCRDCKYWKEGKCWNLKGLNKTDGIVNADDFCSYGERREL